MNAADKPHTAKAVAAAARLPDFIIGGAPKCGTTTLHYILAQHPDIGLPDKEVHYFDGDDPVTHNDFLRTEAGQLVWYDPDADGPRQYYEACFAPYADLPLIGEDSTTYIFSAVAARRIAERLPDVKLVFMLRNPVKRAYSQYWHMMNSARTSLTFEKALARFSNIMLGSTYTPNLKAYFDLFPRNQIKVVLFEDFIGDQQGHLDEITDFLGAARFTVDPDRAWFNKTLYTKHAWLQRWLNVIGRQIAAGRYRSHMADGTAETLTDKLNAKLQHMFFKRFYPVILKADRPPAVSSVTEAYLTSHLTARNKGLSTLLGRDVSKEWGLDI